MRLICFAFLLASTATHAQLLVPEHLCDLPAQMNETSGLLLIGDALWTVLDSGNPADLYQVSAADGSVLRTVQLLGATNVDMEEITADEDWVYIGDFGNNLGSRTDLRIYRIPRWALENESTTAIEVDTIRFTYSDQVDFTPAFDSNNYDCEAFIAIDDSLFLFTKRWLDGQTRLYALPATPGTHTAEARELFDAQGVITAASLATDGRLVLLGHGLSPLRPFTVLFGNPAGHAFLSGEGVRREFDLLDHQTEGIAWWSPDEWVFSNELTGSHLAALWRVAIVQTVEARATIDPSLRLSPQPATEMVHVEGWEGNLSIEVLDETGRCVLRARDQGARFFSVAALSDGAYTVLVSGEGRRSSLRMIVER